MNNIIKIQIPKNVFKRVKIEVITKLRVATLLALLLKTTAFLTIIESFNANKLAWSDITFQFSLIHLAFIALIFSFGYLLSSNKQVKFNIIFNIIYTFMLILDLWYFRANGDFLGLKNIFFTGTFNPTGQWFIMPRAIDLIFIVDIIVLVAWIKLKNIRNNQTKNFLKFSLTFSFSVAVIILSYILLDVKGIAKWDEKLFKVGWSTVMTSKVSGPLGYHGFEAYNTITKILHKPDSEDTKEIKNWLSENREQLSDNEYKGIFKGKNVIFLQLESFENFIINKETNGKEITPFLNKLTREGFYFNNIYEQNNAGNSIDCDFMVNTSILPLGDNITALNYGEVVYNKSLPRLLNSEGYTTISSHAEEKGSFNWTELNKNGFGMDKLWDIDQYKYEETVGYGLSDRSFLTQLAGKLKTVSQPFYINAPTLSSHGPFNIQQKYRELNLPKEIDESYLGGYFESAHYTDKQIEMFINNLDEEGVLDNTVVVIYGDHTGVHKYYNDDIQKLSYEGDWWKEYDHKIPLIIYSKGIFQKTFEASGGQIDIMPTVAYLLGIEDSKYRDDVMGRVLVNTNRNSTVIKGNTIEGQTKNENEKEQLLKAYDVASKIIKDRYMDKN